MQEIIPLKILKFFLENPYEEIYLRELTRKLNISVFAIKKYIDVLVNEKLILEERKANLRYFKGDIKNLTFKQLKITLNINLIQKSKLLDYLKENIPNLISIVLFGSVAKGLDDKNSDLDILIIGKEKDLNVSEFRKKIKREITLHIFSWSEWNKQVKENKAFYYDIISQGISLYGELPIVRK